MPVADSHGFPVAVYAASVSPHEVTLVGETLTQVFTNGQPERLIGDKAYDSDPLDAELAERGIGMIAPHKSNRRDVRAVASVILLQGHRLLRRSSRRVTFR